MSVRSPFPVSLAAQALWNVLELGAEHRRRAPPAWPRARWPFTSCHIVLPAGVVKKESVRGYWTCRGCLRPCLLCTTLITPSIPPCRNPMWIPTLLPDGSDCPFHRSKCSDAPCRNLPVPWRVAKKVPEGERLLLPPAVKTAGRRLFSFTRVVL